jgi:hypothetical protein
MSNKWSSGAAKLAPPAMTQHLEQGQSEPNPSTNMGGNAPNVTPGGNSSTLGAPGLRSPSQGSNLGNSNGNDKQSKTSGATPAGIRSSNVAGYQGMNRQRSLKPPTHLTPGTISAATGGRPRVQKQQVGFGAKGLTGTNVSSHGVRSASMGNKAPGTGGHHTAGSSHNQPASPTTTPILAPPSGQRASTKGAAIVPGSPGATGFGFSKSKVGVFTPRKKQSALPVIPAHLSS